jgi:hypothetical protein
VLILGHSLFNHWTHLGGVAFGALYHCVGPSWWTFLRSVLAAKGSNAEVFWERSEDAG